VSSPTSLTATQLVTVAEIVRENYDTVLSLVLPLVTEQETSIITDVTLWGTIRNSHVKLQGGGQGLDFDNERKREAIRQRIRKMLRLPLVSYELSGYSMSIGHTWIF
jgi:hypothetical protein